MTPPSFNALNDRISSNGALRRFSKSNATKISCIVMLLQSFHFVRSFVLSYNSLTGGVTKSEPGRAQAHPKVALPIRPEKD